MRNLLVIREKLKGIYAKHEVYITPAIKFITAFITLLVIKTNIGYMNKISNIAIILILALMCSFLPYNLIILIASVYTLAHLYVLSLEVTVFVLCVFLLLYLLYFRFSPRDTFAVLLTPVCYMLKIPYVIPLSMGLVGTPVSMVSVGCGTLVYYLLHFISKNAEVIKNMDADGSLTRFRAVVDGLIGNKAMLMSIVAMAVTITIVYIIRRLSVNYAWTIAIVSGALMNIVILLLGDLVYSTNESIPAMFFGTLISVGLAMVLQFFVFNVDYSRSESVQFEDDDYYYYVKAVPKNTVAPTDKTVHRINVQNRNTDEDMKVAPVRKSAPVRQSGTVRPAAPAPDRVQPSDRIQPTVNRIQPTERVQTTARTTSGTMRTAPGMTNGVKPGTDK